MLTLRPYKRCDAAVIARWIESEEVYLSWGGDRFGEYPVTAEMIDEKYARANGDCPEPDNFYPWVAVDDGRGAVGQFIMRYLNGDRRLIRFGWVIVDSRARGRGYGAEMLRLGLRCAFELMGAARVTIGVYEDNAPAHRCYKRVGFRDAGIVREGARSIVEMELTADEWRRAEGRI